MDHRPKPALFRDPEPPRCNPAKALACMPAIPSESRCRHPDQDLQGQNVDGQRGLHSLTSSPSARINRHRPVASGTQFRFSGLIKGLITLKWLGTRLGDDALFAGFGAGWGRDSGSGTGPRRLGLWWRQRHRLGHRLAAGLRLGAAVGDATQRRRFVP